MVRDGMMGVGKLLPLSLSADHRVIDGATAASAAGEDHGAAPQPRRTAAAGVGGAAGDDRAPMATDPIGSTQAGRPATAGGCSAPAPSAWTAAACSASSPASSGASSPADEQGRIALGAQLPAAGTRDRRGDAASPDAAETSAVDEVDVSVGTPASPADGRTSCSTVDAAVGRSTSATQASPYAAPSSSKPAAATSSTRRTADLRPDRPEGHRRGHGSGRRMRRGRHVDRQPPPLRPRRRPDRRPPARPDWSAGGRSPAVKLTFPNADDRPAARVGRRPGQPLGDDPHLSARKPRADPRPRPADRLAAALPARLPPAPRRIACGHARLANDGGAARASTSSSSPATPGASRRSASPTTAAGRSSSPPTCSRRSTTPGPRTTWRTTSSRTRAPSPADGSWTPRRKETGCWCSTTSRATRCVRRARGREGMVRVRAGGRSRRCVGVKRVLALRRFTDRTDPFAPSGRTSCSPFAAP